MDTLQCIKSRLSSRKYASDSIPMEVINDILNAARWAPSPKNRQPWRFAILQGDSKSNFIKRCREELSRKPKLVDYLMSNETISETNTFDIINQAPVLILVFNIFPSEQVLNHYNSSFDYMNMQAIGAAIQNMLLRATELGIGNLWVGDILSVENWMMNQFPETGKLVAGVVLGFSLEKGTYNTERLSISELTIYNGG